MTIQETLETVGAELLAPQHAALCPIRRDPTHFEFSGHICKRYPWTHIHQLIASAFCADTTIIEVKPAASLGEYVWWVRLSIDVALAMEIQPCQ